MHVLALVPARNTITPRVANAPRKKHRRALLKAFFRAFPRDKTALTLDDGRKVALRVRLLIKTQKLGWCATRATAEIFGASVHSDRIL